MGASLVAGVTDLVLRDDAAMRWSLALVAAITTPLSVAWLWRGLPSYRAAVASLRF